MNSELINYYIFIESEPPTIAFNAPVPARSLKSNVERGFPVLESNVKPLKKLNLSLLFGAQLRSLGIFFLYKTKIKKSI